MNALNVLCAQLTRDVFAIAKFLFFNFYVCPVWWNKLATRQLFTAR